MSWVLTHLYEATKNPEHLKKAVEIWEREIQSASSKDLINRTAELYWEIAKAQDALEFYSKSSTNFVNAAITYEKVAKKFPSLKQFYKEHSSYMRAWSELEKAKQRHIEKNYPLSKEHYLEAAKIFGSLEHWNYLENNYLAWAKLEEAEDLSRQDLTEQSSVLFKESADVFEITLKNIKEKQATLEENGRQLIDLIQRVKDLQQTVDAPLIKNLETEEMDAEEKAMLIGLIPYIELRRDYCTARALLDEAKTVYKQGRQAESSLMFESAFEIFDSTLKAHDSIGNELKPLICLCKAWQILTQAEAEGSAELFLEASERFDEARKESTDEKTKNLTTGHSFMCKAMQAGVEYEKTRDQKLCLEAVKLLGSAGILYVKAGFDDASEYVKATQRLFNAYTYIDNATREQDPQQKTRFLIMAEKLLESSSTSYMTAKYPIKSDEIQRLLKEVREEKELSASLSDMLRTSSILSTTETFTAPMPKFEQPVGLGKFEEANIQSKIRIKNSKLQVGSNIELEIELFNVGKGTAKLVKIEQLLPRAFRVTRTPESCRVEDTTLNLMRKSLSPQVAEKISLALKSIERGDFVLSPKILYMDETGKIKSSEPKPLAVEVKEVGISDWLRGTERK
jgi:hypothetical protein